MNRKETTEFLSNLLISDRLTGLGKHYAREVSLDYGTKEVKRVDFMQFEPANTISVSGIEKGIFTCYEIKSCKADFYSGFGVNFVGEKNYLVMTMHTYKDIMHDDTHDDKIPHGVGVLVPVPEYIDIHDEFENPSDISEDKSWKLRVIRSSIPANRKRSMAELLFCMLRSGH